MFQREAKFKHQKQNELVALQKRVQTGREEQKKQRKNDIKKLKRVQLVSLTSSDACLLTHRCYNSFSF